MWDLKITTRHPPLGFLLILRPLGPCQDSESTFCLGVNVVSAKAGRFICFPGPDAPRSNPQIFQLRFATLADADVFIVIVYFFFLTLYCIQYCLQVDDRVWTVQVHLIVRCTLLHAFYPFYSFIVIVYFFFLTLYCIQYCIQVDDRVWTVQVHLIVDDKEGTGEIPYELAYSRWLSGWVLTLSRDLSPPASEELLIVGRGQHVERWKSLRSDYPAGKAGYMKWREDLKHYHASVVTGIMTEEGYSEESCEKVRSMMLKKNIKEREAQVVEDALCLVFLQHQFSAFRMKESEDSMINILRKTWTKMGPKGHEAALALVPSLCEEEQALLTKALGA
eukprot:gene21640-28649_t